MIKRLLIANRGEIACRIIRTAKKLGITCIIVYADPDKNALASQLADVTYPLHGNHAGETYLSIHKIIDAAIATKADAIHPGYGFLSENPAFAKACHEAGIIFVGPSVAALEAMGSKQQAKAILSSTSVPLIPGYHGQDQSDLALKKAADVMTYPVLIKAAAGGGGKGMRLVSQADDLAQAISEAKREAASSFGDETLIIEKWIAEPRHIEVQILADNHGNVIHLFERDCSIQRRHQKIIEEAPAVRLPNNIREKMFEASMTVAKSIQYSGAGTIEYLFDGSQFYFMEMNTRLQVEHPITELITGIDIVEMQINIANNEKLPLKQSEIHCHGHAIECRIYAEDPYKNFMPCLGLVNEVHWPHANKNIRLDTALIPQTEITAFFDPLLAKLSVWSQDRAAAIELTNQALITSQIVGIQTNIDFLKRIINERDYQQEKITTHYIQDHAELLSQPEISEKLWISAALFEILEHQRKIPQNPWQIKDGWHNGAEPIFYCDYLHNNQKITVEVTQKSDHYSIRINQGHCISARAEWLGTQVLVTIDDEIFNARLFLHDDAIWLFSQDFSGKITKFNPNHYYALKEQTGNQLNAPMPGLIVAVMAEQGKSVTRGEALMVIEAMKMQHTIQAPSDGTVTQLYFQMGDQVDEGMELMAFEAAT